jgi:hypothetical protein
MTQDAGSLENLRDIVMPEPVPWWPLAPGWWVLLAFVAIGVILGVVRLAQTWRTNAYRRAALRELKSATSVTAVADILKRTALCAWPRSDVASLAGPAWCEWLKANGRTPLPDSTERILTNDIFQNSLPANAVGELTAFADAWIRRHTTSGES